jgi:hypothetical protein
MPEEYVTTIVNGKEVQTLRGFKDLPGFSAVLMAQADKPHQDVGEGAK